MTYKANDGGPKGSRNKPKPKPRIRQAIDIIAEYQREIRELRAKAS